MNKIFTIFKKELKRFFSDKRMLMSLIMPGVIMFIVYTLMGTMLADSTKVQKEYTYNVVAVNTPERFDNVFNNDTFKIKLIDKKDMTDNELKAKVQEKELDLYVVFDENFEEKLTTTDKPNIQIFYNSSSNESRSIFTYVYGAVSQDSAIVSYNYLINMDPNIKYDLVTEEDATIQIVQMLVPYLLVIFLFTGCLAVTTESIAGEKERGTINTLLVTPTKRSHIAIGKILALSVTALVSATSSFIGILLSIPTLMKGSGVDVNVGIYNFSTIAFLFIIIILTVILFTTILSIISAIAKNVKEAQQWSSIIMMVVMFLGITSLMSNGNIPTNPFLYLIPIYNSVQSMSAIFAMDINPICFLMTVISNVAFIALGVYLLARMFNSEKMMSSN